MFRIQGIPYLEQNNRLYFRGNPQTSYTSFPNEKKYPTSPIKNEGFHIRINYKTTCRDDCNRDIPIPDLEGVKISVLCKIQKYSFKSKLSHNYGEFIKGWNIIAVRINIC